MQPLTFTCRAVIPDSPEAICLRIADVDSWTTFAGYGPIPGIARAEYERRCEAMVGSRIRVENRDGSTHVEEILDWKPDERVVLRLQDFSAPLGSIAAHFEEEWTFTRVTGGTRVARRFLLVPRSRVGRAALLLILPLLRRAVTRQLDQLRGVKR